MTTTVVAPEAWTYSGDPSTSDRDAVRFLLGDTDGTVRLLSDAEIDYLLELWMPEYDSVVYVASIAANQVAARYTGVVDVSADGVTVAVGDLAARYRELARALREQYRSQPAGALDLAGVLIGHYPDPSIRPLTFGRGMHDNISAGQQDYGGAFNPWEQARQAYLLYGTPDA